MTVTKCDVQRIFIGAGCNRIVNNVSWGACDLVAFGAQNAVSIFCPKAAQILTTLPGHKASVNCTHWLPSSKFAFRAKQLDQHFLLSGDADGVIILWKFSLGDRKWRHVLNVPQSHKKGVTCITATMISLTEAVFASTSTDGVVNIWEVILPSNGGGNCKLSCFDSLSVGLKPMVALSLAELPGGTGHLVLAMGGLDNKIHLYSGQRTGKFVRACELKGHSDWIRSLDFSLPICTDGINTPLLLVSSSQDKGIRIWKMVLCDSHDKPESKKLISLASYIEGPILVAGSTSYQLSLESLLIGHEDWVYSVVWQPPLVTSAETSGYFQPQCILSASMDKTMMIWQPEKTTGIWVNIVTVGELSHCALGFYGGHWSPNGDSILAHGYGGSFHLWKNVGVNTDNWQPQKVPSGHHSVVSDIAWARSGEFMLSVSHDQTSRIFSPWLNEGNRQDGDSWHEIARPQVHGHDINCTTLIQGKGNYRFVSGAEEKVARVFEAPLSFLKTLNCATSHESDIHEDIKPDFQILGANMSALGLSQKPIYVHAAHETSDRSGSEGLDTLETIPDAVPVTLTEPPIEEQLAWHTLWPDANGSLRVLLRLIDYRWMRQRAREKRETNMQRPRRWRAVGVVRRLLICAICVIGVTALFSVNLHVFPHSKTPKLPDPYKLPAQHEIGIHKVGTEQNVKQEFTPPQFSRSPLPHKLDPDGGLRNSKLWKSPPNRDYTPCVEPSSNYTSPLESMGFLLVHTNGGLNQMRAGICDMVAVTRIINATLVIPELDKRSFWQDSSNFADVFDQDHFINALANDIKVIKKLPKAFSTAPRAVKHFRSWSGINYYQNEIASMWTKYQVIRAAKSDSRLANNDLPLDIQKLRCRACYEALRFSPKIEAMGKLLVDRMRNYGRYIALHLRYEKDMLAFSGCTHGLSPEEAEELKMIRENTSYWKVKEINATEQRSKGYCPLTPKEVGIFLTALRYPSDTPIYIAAGEIYGGESRMADLQSRYPILMSKEKLASVEELKPFTNHASQMAALDYIVSVESDVFIPSYSGNMARAVEGHRRYLGHRKTITPDRKVLVRVCDKLDKGTLKEGNNLSNKLIEIHRRRQGSPRKRKRPIPGTKGMDRFRSEEAFYENPLPECLCQRGLSEMNTSMSAIR